MALTLGQLIEHLIKAKNTLEEAGYADPELELVHVDDSVRGAITIEKVSIETDIEPTQNANVLLHT